MSVCGHSWETPTNICPECGADWMADFAVGPTPTEPGTPQTAAVLLSDLDNDPAYLQGVKDGRAARDAEVRAAAQARYDDLRWCNKADNCHDLAEGAQLVLDDIRAILDTDTQDDHVCLDEIAILDADTPS